MSQNISARHHRITHTLATTLLGVPFSRLPSLLPGVAATALLAWLATWLAEFVGKELLGFERSPVSAVMMAILLGMVVSNSLPLPAWLRPGTTFSVKKLLRLGIILLGIRLSFLDVFRLGALGVPVVLTCIVGALVITTAIGRRLRLPRRLAVLIAVGTAICGVSAIVATGPAIEAEDEEVAYAVAVITVFGILATLAYPYLAYILFAGDAVRAGLFIGTSVHDTSQVTGAAMVFSEVYARAQALDVATVTKMVRNVLMAAVIPLMSLYWAHTSADGTAGGRRTSVARLLPLFVLGFLALAALRSIGDAGLAAGRSALGLWDAAQWRSIYGAVNTWAGQLLVVALAGVGLETRFSILKGLGIKPFIAGLAAALAVGVVSYAAISVLGAVATL